MVITSDADVMSPFPPTKHQTRDRNLYHEWRGGGITVVDPKGCNGKMRLCLSTALCPMKYKQEASHSSQTIAATTSPLISRHVTF